MVQKLFMDYVTKMQVATYVGVEDFADKFNFIFTVIVLLICTAVVTVKQYILKPISCYISTDIGGKNLLEYVENYCWVQGTIPISYSSDTPETENDWNRLESHKILYYQWVPFVLGLQCILFYIPRVIWQIICYNQTGTDIYHLISMANEAGHSKPDKKEEIVKNLAQLMEQLLFHHREMRTGRPACIRRKIFQHCPLFYIGKRLGNRLFGTYLLIKVLYILNAVGQIYVLQSFIGLNHKDHKYLGLSMTKSIINGRDWQVTLNFPRVGFCVVPIRQLAGQVFVTAQCALPVNMLNERVYIFLSYWFLLGSAVTITSVPLWFLRMAHRRSRAYFVKRYLRLDKLCSCEDDIMVQKFCHQFLRHDGIFLLRMMAINSGSTICGSVVQNLWYIYKTKYYNRDFNHADDAEDEASEIDFPSATGRHHTTIQLESARPSAPPPSSSSGYSEDLELKKLPI